MRDDIIQTDTPFAAPVVTCLLLKVASRCNLACDYCYVYEHADQSWREQPKLMSVATGTTVGKRLNEYLTENDSGNVTVVFHGGEPLLLGPKRMEALIQAIKRELDDVARVGFSIQTNGVLLSPRWLDLFLRFGVTVSLSADGPKHFNDLHRLDHLQRSTYNRVERAIVLLTRSPEYREIFGGILAVIDLGTDPVRILRWAQDLDVPSIDFLLPDGTYDDLPSGVLEPGIRDNSAPYGNWLSKAFDHWYTSDSSLRVRLFENLLDLSLGGQSSTEGIGLGHFSILTIETDGEIQDTDVMKVTKQGGPAFDPSMNVATMSLREALASAPVRQRAALARSLPPICTRCAIVNTCGAGHLPHRYSVQNGFSNPSIYCGDLSHMIRHVSATVQRDLSCQTSQRSL